MKSEKYQNENKGGSLNEKAKKGKGKHEISQKQKYVKKEKKEKVTKKENYTKSNLEKKYVALETDKKEIIQQTEKEEQNWEANEKDQRDVELTNKAKKNIR